jgi:tetratricopeptide (TPR) repeat protein
MSDGVPDRITQLRARWQSDPSSRIFLQLAEEYRHLGRVQEALAVLEGGLKEHPGYLSALVAKGRCLLELGDPGQARGVLERVVQQDATQMVANKLLVRAYLETGEPARAGQRLDLYTLLNDSDPEIEELRRRVVAMSRASRVPDGQRAAEPAERPRMDRETPESRDAGSDVFDLGHGETPEGDADLAQGPGDPVRPVATGADLFGASQAEPTPPPPPEAAPPLATAPAAAGLRPRGEDNGSDPFPDLDPARSLALYLAGLEAESVFEFGAMALAPPAVAAAEPAAGGPEPAVAEEPAAKLPEPVAAKLPEPVAAVAAEPAAAPPEPVAAAGQSAAAPEAPAAEPAPPMATATLGELYRRQGHLDEAERIFREVIAREPGNDAARLALAELAGAASPAPGAAGVTVTSPERQEQPPAGRPGDRPLDAAQLLAGLDRPQASAPARKAYLLQSYLTRLRQTRRPRPNVS